METDGLTPNMTAIQSTFDIHRLLLDVHFIDSNEKVVHFFLLCKDVQVM